MQEQHHRTTSAPSEHPVVIVGAGAAGIASALTLKDVGVPSVVLEQEDEIAPRWRTRYDRLRLNTSRFQSHLPGRPFPDGTPMFASRDQLIGHLEEHAREEHLDIRLGVHVDRVEPDHDGWLVRAGEETYHAPEVIVATAFESRPLVPPWPGRAGFRGTVIHAADYHNAGRFRDRRVLVVGPASSGMEIAYELAEGGAARVWLAVRTPPNILLRRGPLGIPGDLIGRLLLRLPSRIGDTLSRKGREARLGDLEPYGLPVPEEGVISRLRRLEVAPAIVDEEVIDAIREGRIEIVAAVESLDETGVILADGGRVEPDDVICATGYQRGLEPLVGHLDVLDEDGTPTARHGRPAAPGLRFIGFVPRPGGLGYMGKEARRAAKAIRRELRARA